MRIAAAITTLVLLHAVPAAAQRVRLDPQPRRQFVSIWFETQYIQPLHFKQYPLEQLVGQPLGEVQDPNDPADYRARDGITTVDVLEFNKRTEAVGITVFPFGARNGAALALTASRETLPVIRFDIRGSGVFEHYQLTDGRATDLGLGVFVNDRPRGWGLGARSFVVAGYGRLTGERGDGRRYFAEGGGGANIGPIGVDLAVKFAYNKVSDPRPHTFFTVPIAIRGSVNF